LIGGIVLSWEVIDENRLNLALTETVVLN
jgi:hypothetical protein